MSIGDETAALFLAMEACRISEWENPLFIDTVAAAYAAQGNFDNAVMFERGAILTSHKNTRVSKNSLSGFLRVAKHLLQIYEAREAYTRDIEPRCVSENSLDCFVCAGLRPFLASTSVRRAPVPSTYQSSFGVTPNLQQVVCQTNQLPLGSHFFQATQQKPTNPTRLFDLAEYRLHNMLAGRVKKLA